MKPTCKLCLCKMTGILFPIKKARLLKYIKF